MQVFRSRGIMRRFLVIISVLCLYIVFFIFQQEFLVYLIDKQVYGFSQIMIWLGLVIKVLFLVIFWIMRLIFFIFSFLVFVWVMVRGQEWGGFDGGERGYIYFLFGFRLLYIRVLYLFVLYICFFGVGILLYVK